MSPPILLPFFPGGLASWASSSSSYQNSEYSTAILSPLAKASLALLLISHAGKMRGPCSHALVSFIGIVSCIGYELLLTRLLGFFVLALHATMGPKRSLVGFLFWAGWENMPIASWSDDLKTIIMLGLACFAIRRIGLLLLTLSASSPMTMFFVPFSFLMPRYSFTDVEFFRADGCPETLAQKREASFEALELKWKKKWPKSLETSQFLQTCFSDLRFMSSNRVFLPFQRKIENWCDPCTVVQRSDGPYLTDVDGHRLIDVSGSYGVNVCGYDLYKRFLREGVELVGNLGPVLGPINPILLDNIEMIKRVTMQDEVSFHMSGTEAVMAGLRLCRFNTGRPLVVLFTGSYHGWWDGVQPLAGNERPPFDVLTLNDMSPRSLQVIKWRYREIAAVVVNPLQAFHPNAPPPSDLALATNNRHVSESTNSYKTWLVLLRDTCRELGIVFFMDEVFTGARLSRGGAQEYFGIQADMVALGKTFGGGQAIGLLAGPRKLMNRIDPNAPLRVAYVVGTFAAAPLTLACQNRFLKWLLSDETKSLYDKLRRDVAIWRDETNERLSQAFDGKSPIQVQSYSTVWCIMYQRPSRYNFLLQYYMREEGFNLSWVGTGRVCFSLDFQPKDFAFVREQLVASCLRMEQDGWWVRDSDSIKLGSEIKFSLAKEISKAMMKRLFS
jgi:glutamate-1-semialdehyde 2,1-aminomutase